MVKSRAIDFRHLLLAALLILACGRAAADTPERGWTLGTSFGIQWGQAREIAHYDPNPSFPNQNEYLSLLLWDMQNIPIMSLDTRWESGSRLGLDFNLGVAIPGVSTGQMNDYDWFFTDRDWSHWSLSDASLRWGFTADASADWRIAEKGAFSFQVGVAYHLDWWAWTDILRDLIYSTTKPSDQIEIDGGEYYPLPFKYYPAYDSFRTVLSSSSIGKNGVDYEVAYHTILAVLRLRLDKPPFFAELTGRIGPALAMSLDYHKLRGRQFFDIGVGLPWIDGALELGFRTSDRFSIVLRGELAWMNEIRGDVLVYDDWGFLLGGASGGGGFGILRGGVSLQVAWTLDPAKPRTNP